MRQRVKPFTRWGGNTLSASMSGTGVVGAADPVSWNLPETINIAQSDSVGVRQYATNATGWTITVTGLATGLTYNAGTESIDGAATGTASGTATFTLSKSGETDVVDTATVALIELGAWQLAEGHFVPAKMPMTLVYPRPDGETQSWARHKKAYPGIEYRIPIAVQGGAYPFYYEIIEGPAWLSIGQQYGQTDYGVLKGTPPAAAAAQTVRVRVTDQELNSVDAVFSLTATTSGFTIVEAPSYLEDLGSVSTNIIILRGGTHYTRRPENAQLRLTMRSGTFPLVYIGYPGESVTVDLTNANFHPQGGSTLGCDVFLGGLTIQNNAIVGTDSSRMIDPSSGSSVLRTTLFENHFKDFLGNQAPGTSNQGILHIGSGPCYYQCYWGNTLENINGRGFGSLYVTKWGVCEDNEQLDNGNVCVILDLKSENSHWSYRRNKAIITSAHQDQFQQRHGSYGGGVLGSLYTEVCYNLLRTPVGGDHDEALVFGVAGSTNLFPNYNYIYRNTLVGVSLHESSSLPRLERFEGNIHFCDTTHILNEDPADVTIEEGTGDFANLYGARSDISVFLDAEYKLQGSYRTTYLGKRGHEIA